MWTDDIRVAWSEEEDTLFVQNGQARLHHQMLTVVPLSSVLKAAPAPFSMPKGKPLLIPWDAKSPTFVPKWLTPCCDLLQLQTPCNRFFAFPHDRCQIFISRHPTPRMTTICKYEFFDEKSKWLVTIKKVLPFRFADSFNQRDPILPYGTSGGYFALLIDRAQGIYLKVFSLETLECVSPMLNLKGKRMCTCPDGRLFTIEKERSVIVHEMY
jgi:hypothetical protein